MPSAPRRTAAAKKHSTPKPPGDVVLLVGTMKGAFLFWSNAKRRTWKREGPHFPGESVYAMAYDGRGGRKRLWAAPRSMHWGAVVRTSDDFGKSWSAPDRQNVRFPEGSGLSLAQIWQLAPGPDADPDLMYCGVEPAALFDSRDGGESWTVVRGLLDHPHR